MDGKLRPVRRCIHIIVPVLVMQRKQISQFMGSISQTGKAFPAAGFFCRRQYIGVLGIISRLPPSIHMQVCACQPSRLQPTQLFCPLLKCGKIGYKYRLGIFHGGKPATGLHFLPNSRMNYRCSPQFLGFGIALHLLFQRNQFPLFFQPVPIRFTQGHIVTILKKGEPHRSTIRQLPQAGVPQHLHTGSPSAGMAQRKACIPGSDCQRHVSGASPQLPPPRHIGAPGVHMVTFQFPVVIQIKLLLPAIGQQHSLHQRIYRYIPCITAVKHKGGRPSQFLQPGSRFCQRYCPSIQMPRTCFQPPDGFQHKRRLIRKVLVPGTQSLTAACLHQPGSYLLRFCQRCTPYTFRGIPLNPSSPCIPRLPTTSGGIDCQNHRVFIQRYFHLSHLNLHKSLLIFFFCIASGSILPAGFSPMQRKRGCVVKHSTPPCHNL